MALAAQQRIRVPVLLGPTAAGKSALALHLAEDLDLEILSCDSRQIYRGMDIGTAKPDRRDREKIRHWLIDICDPSEYYSAFRFSRDAGAVINERASKNKHVLLCGGTGLYFRCLSRGMGPQTPENRQVRERCEKKVSQDGPDSIFEELRTVDPQSAGSIHPRDMRRTIRALEIFYTTGITASELIKRTRPQEDFEYFVIVVTLPREDLYQRINARVEEMFSKGLWNEFRRLRQSGYHESSPGMRTLGYAELFDVERGRTSIEQACIKIQQNTRRYAKRQSTWFRGQVNGDFYDISRRHYHEIKNRFVRFLNQRQPTDKC